LILYYLILYINYLPLEDLLLELLLDELERLLLELPDEYELLLDGRE
jgi:hypothetical protein